MERKLVESCLPFSIHFLTTVPPACTRGSLPTIVGPPARPAFLGWVPGSSQGLSSRRALGSWPGPGLMEFLFNE